MVLQVLLFIILSKARSLGKKQYHIKFIDSLKILPASLSKLASSYELDTGKMDFPYLFMNSYDKIDYIGPYPDKSYLNYDINMNQVDVNTTWNAKNDTKTFQFILIYTLTDYYIALANYNIE
jgi:hypothetical protein